jgi:hypothetical protein
VDNMWIYHLVICHSSPWKDPPIFKFGKPSISMGHVYHGELLNNQMVYIDINQYLIELDDGKIYRKPLWVMRIGIGFFQSMAQNSGNSTELQRSENHGTSGCFHQGDNGESSNNI